MCVSLLWFLVSVFKQEQQNMLCECLIVHVIISNDIFYTLLIQYDTLIHVCLHCDSVAHQEKM